MREVICLFSKSENYGRVSKQFTFDFCFWNFYTIYSKAPNNDGWICMKGFDYHVRNTLSRERRKILQFTCFHDMKGWKYIFSILIQYSVA